MKRERRQLTHAELASVTSSRPVVWWIKKEEATKTFAGVLTRFTRDNESKPKEGGPWT